MALLSMGKIHTGGPLGRKRHGMFGTRVYQQWADMIRRCENPKYSSWHNYGGRGIRVCDRWRTDFVNFHEDMGAPPDGFQLDRIDNDGNYEPSNCRWVTPSRNTRNRRVSIVITAFGRTQTMPDWADEVGIDRKVIAGRLRRGWHPEEALTRPPNLGNASIRRRDRLG